MRWEVLIAHSRYTKDQIALAPNNPSAWNYLRGILEHSNTPFSTLRIFVEPYTKPQSPESSASKEEEILDLENPAPSPTAELPCVAALEFLADIYEKGEEKEKAVEVRWGLSCLVILWNHYRDSCIFQIWKQLGNELDTIRKK